ncbi:hypothetical protein D6833_04950 [Candidatus Parcubacteria bacterium]|nr:MAG: hypothetical protein D6833_04950 [Candidatus Parcubacteria bacterium]
MTALKKHLDTGGFPRVSPHHTPDSVVKTADLQPGYFPIPTWRLSDKARRIPLAEWRRIGGCGLPGDSLAFVRLGPESSWDESSLTLGDIEDACPYTGRTLARFAVEHLGRGDFAVPYEPEE